MGQNTSFGIIVPYIISYVKISEESISEKKGNYVSRLRLALLTGFAFAQELRATGALRVRAAS